MGHVAEGVTVTKMSWLKRSGPSLLDAKSSGRTQGLWRRQVLHSRVGAEHKAQAAAASEQFASHKGAQIRKQQREMVY